MIAMLSREQVLNFWPALVPKIVARPESSGYSTPDELLVGVLDGHLQAWVLASNPTYFDILFLTEIVDRPKGRAMLFAGAWGDGMAEYLEEIALELPNICAALGCTTVEIEGRPGWERLMKKIGFKTIRVTMAMDFRPTMH